MCHNLATNDSGNSLRWVADHVRSEEHAHCMNHLPEEARIEHAQESLADGIRYMHGDISRVFKV